MKQGWRTTNTKPSTRSQSLDATLHLQMVWEQGVSVIVMLTRLNENNVPMCHCYWPTGATSPPNQEEAAPTHEASNERRNSVTSVLNTSCARQNGNGQPIVTNGEPNNNVLYLEIGPTGGGSLFGGSNSSLEEQAECAAKVGAGDSTVQRVHGGLKLEVHLVSEHVSSGDYLVRNMYIINRTNGETKTITQFHYLAWPENGVPSNVKSFLHFRRKVNKCYRNLKSPILVHCSDGAGRSGTYTLIDIILNRIKNGAKEIDPRATLEHLRDQRMGLCATKSQFEFVLVALAEEIQIILNALPR